MKRLPTSVFALIEHNASATVPSATPARDPLCGAARVARGTHRARALVVLSALAAIAACVLLGAFAPAARAQGSRKDDVVFNAQGRPMAGASVRICTSAGTGQPCTPLANIYSDAALTQAMANPLATDGLGNYTFYAAPGRYEIEISGPGITTKQLPNVILPNDPSSPTFTSLSTTSGISAFSLSLSGNLTVVGSAAVTGTLTVGGAPVPSTAQPNVWSATQSFAGPSPWIDMSAMTATTCPYYPFLEYGPNALGSITAGSHALTVTYLNSAVVPGCGVMIHGAGATSTMAAPTSVAIVNHNGGGTKTYKYQIVAIDGNLHGTSPASSVATTTTGAATLSKFQYNYVTATIPVGAIGVLVYSDKGLGGALSCIGVSRAVDVTDNFVAFEDMGFYSGQQPCPVWAPATPPTSAGNQTLISTITSISGTTITIAAAAAHTVTNGLYHSDNTAAMQAALTAECNSAIPGNGTSKPRILIPPGASYALAYMPPSPCTYWNIESYGALFMSDGLGFDIPGGALWLGRAIQEPQSPAGNGYASLISGTYDGPGVTSTIDDPVVLLTGYSPIIDGLTINGAFDGIAIVNVGSVNLQHVYFSAGGDDPQPEGCGIRIIGQNIGPNFYGPGVLDMKQDTTGVGSVCVDGVISPGGDFSNGSRLTHMRDLNFVGHGIYATCPFGCAAHNSYSMYLWDIRGGLTENQGDAFWGLLDPGTTTEGSTYGANSVSINDFDEDNDPFQGPCFNILQPPSPYLARIENFQLNNAACGGAVGSVDVNGNQTLQPVSINSLLVGPNCGDGAPGGRTGAAMAWAQIGPQNGWGIMRTRGEGSCFGPRAMGAEGGVGVYQNGYSSGVPIHNFNFATLIPPPEVTSTSTTTGTLAGTYYYRLSVTDCAGRESQAGPEVKATASSQGIVLNYLIGGGFLYGACGVNVYRGTASQAENLLLGSSSPVTTSLTTFTDTGSLSTTSLAPPVDSQAFESVLAEQNDYSYIFASQAANLYQKRLGFGCSSDPGLSSNTKWQFCGRTQFQSGVVVPLATKTSAYALTINDYWVNVTGTSTVTVPHATIGQLWIVFNSGSGTVTLQADSGNVNGASSVTLSANTGYNVTCDGANCFATH